MSRIRLPHPGPQIKPINHPALFLVLDTVDKKHNDNICTYMLAGWQLGLQLERPLSSTSCRISGRILRRK